jgi:hypothetical protein
MTLAINLKNKICVMIIILFADLGRGKSKPYDGNSIHKAVSMKKNRVTRFNELTMVDKVWLTYEFGDFLMSIEYYNYKIYLYALNSQFIELYQNIKTRQIETIIVAIYGALDKYANRILIGSLKKKYKT